MAAHSMSKSIQSSMRSSSNGELRGRSWRRRAGSLCGKESAHNTLPGSAMHRTEFGASEGASKRQSPNSSVPTINTTNSSSRSNVCSFLAPCAAAVGRSAVSMCKHACMHACMYVPRTHPYRNPLIVCVCVLSSPPLSPWSCLPPNPCSPRLARVVHLLSPLLLVATLAVTYACTCLNPIPPETNPVMPLPPLKNTKKPPTLQRCWFT